jgi:hypothetical protein
MSYKLDPLGEAGLQFFGKMSSSNFHEIKNALAIINENAGLMEDLAMMAEKGMPVDSEKLKILSWRIMRQVLRANEIIQNINRFSRSVEQTADRVNLGEFLCFLAELSGRFAEMQGVTLKPEILLSPVIITTRPFFLENLVWLCLNFAMKASGKGKTVGLVAESTETGTRIRFTQLEAIEENLKNQFPTAQENALLRALNAEISIDTDAGEIVLSLP